MVDNITKIYNQIMVDILNNQNAEKVGGSHE